jgi:hypothetical protein
LTVLLPGNTGSFPVTERLLGLLALSVHDTSWLIIYFACLFAVPRALLVIATLAAIFDPKRGPVTRKEILHELLDVFFRGKQP